MTFHAPLLERHRVAGSNLISATRSGSDTRSRCASAKTAAVTMPARWCERYFSSPGGSGTAAVPGAVAPTLPAGGTAGKEAQAPGAAAAYAAKRLYYQRHHLVALIETRVVVVAPVEGDVALACLMVKGGEAAGGRGPGRRQVAGAAAKDRTVQPLLSVAEGDQISYALALIFGRGGPERRGTLVSPIQSVPQALAPG